jgi:hypothetical protein
MFDLTLSVAILSAERKVRGATILNVAHPHFDVGIYVDNQGSDLYMNSIHCDQN